MEMNVINIDNPLESWMKPLSTVSLKMIALHLFMNRNPRLFEKKTSSAKSRPVQASPNLSKPA